MSPPFLTNATIRPIKYDTWTTGTPTEKLLYIFVQEKSGTTGLRWLPYFSVLFHSVLFLTLVSCVHSVLCTPEPLVFQRDLFDEGVKACGLRLQRRYRGCRGDELPAQMLVLLDQAAQRRASDRRRRLARAQAVAVVVARLLSIHWNTAHIVSLAFAPLFRSTTLSQMMRDEMSKKRDNCKSDGIQSSPVVLNAGPVEPKRWSSRIVTG